MSFTLNDAPVTAFDLAMPEYGNWTARVYLSTDVRFAAGATASLAIENATFTGTVIKGGGFLSRSAYLIVGGAGAWRLALPTGGFRSDGGIRLSTAASAVLKAANDVAAAKGLKGREALMVTTDRNLGAAHVRFATTGSATLDTLGKWYVRPDGVTVIGTRPAPTITAPAYVVEKFDPTKDEAEIAVPSADVAGFIAQIGGTITGAPLEGAVPFRALRIALADGRLRFTVNP